MVKDVLVSGKLDTPDVVRFLFYHNYSRLGGALTGLFGLIGLVLSPIMFLTGDMASGIILALVGFMYGIFTPLGFYTKARRQIRTNPVFKNKMTFKFTSDMLKVQLYTGASEILWQDVYVIKSLRDQMLIYIEETHALILPLRYFACEDDVALVKDFVQRNQLDLAKNRRLEVEIHDDET